MKIFEVSRMIVNFGFYHYIVVLRLCTMFYYLHLFQFIGQYDGIAFEELDVALKQVAAEDSMSVEVTLPRKAPRRARSLSRNNTETLPDEVSKKLFLYSRMRTMEHFWTKNCKK